jgi:hypothetical protein
MVWRHKTLHGQPRRSKFSYSCLVLVPSYLTQTNDLVTDGWHGPFYGEKDIHIEIWVVAAAGHAERGTRVRPELSWFV